MTLRENPRVLEFVGRAEKLRSLLESEAEDIPVWIRSVFVTLASLYSAGLNLPVIEVEEEDIWRLPKEFRVTSEEVGAVLNRIKLSLGRHDLYHDVFDPTDQNDHESICGTLSDDLSDIYRDIVSELRVWQGSHDEVFASLAVNGWRESLSHHWGLHATEAMRALHFLVEDRELSAFRAKSK